MGRQAKPEFADLDDDWKSSVESMSDEEVDSKIAEIAKEEAEIQNAKKDDQQLKEAKLAARMAGEGYREAAKMAKQRIQYCLKVLESRGKL